MEKINIAILFGGKSAEHEVSVLSAKNVVAALDKNKYQPVLIGIDKNGAWHLLETLDGDISSIEADIAADEIVLLPGREGQLYNVNKKEYETKVDAVFPVIHGPMGEDGTLQGLLKIARVPFVGAGVLGSAVGMDKDVMKCLLRQAGLPIGKFLCFYNYQSIDYNKITGELGTPVFVKPANLGSSVGISKANNAEEFAQALALAFRYDTKIVIEQAIVGREIECAVLGNDNPRASIPGEVSTSHDFYSYQAKYQDEKGVKIVIPAELPDAAVKDIQEMAVKTFQVLQCSGLGRVDFFLQPDGKALVNEINTIPGFTSVSMYPMMWQKSGIEYPDLIDRLIELAQEKYQSEAKLDSEK